ncbi:hypothetical protein CF641_37865 [Burkholderia pseudomallei]|uniref:hypothetical protein n=1 Tax=Burkholderia pseudomallei TaxID=28450 RepID=UPI000CCF78D4|nr:hypothetical protein [Burkholderia pseudomallei]PNW89285.1 hypothetical protein CF641_37865 [Burkholderia pseudomallei]
MPILDILQSVPVLGYISFTVTFFLALIPSRVLGAEHAARNQREEERDRKRDVAEHGHRLQDVEDRHDAAPVSYTPLPLPKTPYV